MHRELIGHVNNPKLFQAFCCFWATLQQRTDRVFVSHIKSHTVLPGALVVANAWADRIDANAKDTNKPHKLEEARRSHVFFSSIISCATTKIWDILSRCKSNRHGLPWLCLHAYPAIGRGKPPRPTAPRNWLAVDICSHTMWTTALTSISAKAITQHMLQVFAVMGILKEIKRIMAQLAGLS